MNITKTYINALTPQLSERDFVIIGSVGRFELAAGRQIDDVMTHPSDSGQ